MDERARELLRHVTALERRDESLAAEIARVVRLEARVGAVRARSSELEGFFAALPSLAATAEKAERASAAAVEEASAVIAEAERRVTEVERSRRKREDELDQARRELNRAREERIDAEAALQRHAERRAALVDAERTSRAEAKRLVDDARAVSQEIAGVRRAPDSGRTAPGVESASLQDWGGEVRASLFVARGGLETEREHIVDEANALGSAVLGEPLGASSVAVVRRRIAERLGVCPAGTDPGLHLWARD